MEPQQEVTKVGDAINISPVEKKPFESSKDLGELFMALSKAQGSMEAAKKDQNNPFFRSKYADLHSCWEAIRKPFADNELAITQLPSQGEAFEVTLENRDDQTGEITTRVISGRTVKVTTILAHSSGQWITNLVELKPTKTDPQGMGSAMTYARRYGLMAAAGIAPEEDDGNAASNPQGGQSYEKKTSTPGIPKDKKPVTTGQLKRLRAIASSASWGNDSVSFAIEKMFQHSSSKKLNMKQYDELVDMIQKNTPEEAHDVLMGDAINDKDDNRPFNKEEPRNFAPGAE